MAEELEEHVDEQLGDEVEPERPALDPETAARRASALAQVRQFGDPVLKAKAVPVERFDDQLRAEVARMAGIMGDAIGVGLAATQLGVVSFESKPRTEITTISNHTSHTKAQ